MSFIDYDKEILIINNYIEMKRYSHALDKLVRLLEEQPSDPYLIYLYAYCFYRLGRYGEAMDSCKAALDSGYSVDGCYYLFSRIYIQMDKYEEAESFLLTAMEINPQNPELIAFYGYLMMLCGRNHRALELINEALRIDPENLSALHYKFYYYLDMDDRHGIKSRLVEKYFSLSTDEGDRFLKAGLLDYHSYNYDSAEENFRQAFQLDPTNKFVLKMLERINRKPRFFFYWKRRIRSHIMRRLAVVRTVLKAKWILFKCVGLTRDTLVFAAVPAGLLLLIAVALIILF